MRPGTKVIKNPDTWIPNDFDSWGRGEGIGIVVPPPYPMGRHEVDVRWPGGRCFEETKQILRVTKKTKLQLSNTELKRLRFLMSVEYYTSKKDLIPISAASYKPYKDQLQRKHEAHKLFDLIRLPEKQREKMWIEHRNQIGSYGDVYKLKPVKEGRDNKDIRVGSGYGGRDSIRYPRKGHKSAWKKFYKLFPRLHPNYTSDTLNKYASGEALKILNKKSN